MEGSYESRSEVARLLKQISDEYNSAQSGLAGLAYGTSQHKVITKKMENIGKWHEELQALVGETEATALVAQHLETCPDISAPSM